MNATRSPLYLLVVCLGMSGVSWSQTYNFESISGGSILSESGWTTTDSNQADGVEAEQNLFFPTTSGNNVGLIGGYR